MNLPRINLIVILFLAFGIAANGQEPPKARLVHGFTNLGTDYFRSSIDLLLTELKNSPDSNGFIVIHGGDRSISHKFAVEQRVKNHLKFRSSSNWNGFDVNRIFIIRGNKREKTEIELWLGNANDKPKLDEAVWSFDLPINETKLFFGEGNLEFSTRNGSRAVWIGECSMDCEPTSDAFVFAEYLRHNPQFSGRLIAYGDSKQKALVTANKLRSFLVSEYSISKDRLSTEFGGKKQDDFPDVGIWLIPNLRKQ